MPIHFACPNCKRSLRVSRKRGGQEAPCPSCGYIVQIPFSDAPPSVPPKPVHTETTLPVAAVPNPKEQFAKESSDTFVQKTQNYLQKLPWWVWGSLVGSGFLIMLVIIVVVVINRGSERPVTTAQAGNSIVGLWQGENDDSVVEFKANGTVSMDVRSYGGSINKYSWQGDGKFKIKRKRNHVIYGVKVSGDEMEVALPKGKLLHLRRTSRKSRQQDYSQLAPNLEKPFLTELWLIKQLVELAKIHHEGNQIRLQKKMDEVRKDLMQKKWRLPLEVQVVDADATRFNCNLLPSKPGLPNLKVHFCELTSPPFSKKPKWSERSCSLKIGKEINRDLAMELARGNKVIVEGTIRKVTWDSIGPSLLLYISEVKGIDVPMITHWQQ